MHSFINRNPFFDVSRTSKNEKRIEMIVALFDKSIFKEKRVTKRDIMNSFSNYNVYV